MNEKKKTSGNERKNDSHMESVLLMPRDSGKFLNSLGNDLFAMNLYLAQNRFYTRIRKFKKDENGRETYRDYYSSKLEDFVRDGYKDRRNTTGQTTEISPACKRLIGLMNSLNKRNEKIAANYSQFEKYSLKPHDKVIFGEGNSVYLGVQPLKLHPLYGIPFIPASTIKGTLRSVWIMEKFNGEEKTAEKDENFVKLFGGNHKDSLQAEGKLIFFDTFPKKFSIGLDAQAIHYKDYYQKGNCPTDDQNVMPVKYICLRNAEFTIYISCCEKEVWDQNKAEIDRMMDCMRTQYGIGAKTALGYGVV